MAYDKIDPIGTWREDFRTAELISLIVNIVSKLYAKKGHTPKDTNPIDFMPDWIGEKEEEQGQTTEQMKEILLAFAATHNKKVGSKKPSNKPRK